MNYLMKIVMMMSANYQKVIRYNNNTLIHFTSEEKKNSFYEKVLFKYGYFLFQDTDEAEILWRLSRALYNKSNSVNSAEKYELIRVGYDIINKAMILEENNFAVHKWFSILADAKASSEGIKSRIKQLINVKNHMLVCIF